MIDDPHLGAAYAADLRRRHDTAQRIMAEVPSALDRLVAADYMGCRFEMTHNHTPRFGGWPLNREFMLLTTGKIVRYTIDNEGIMRVDTTWTPSTFDMPTPVSANDLVFGRSLEELLHIETTIKELGA